MMQEGTPVKTKPNNPLDKQQQEASSHTHTHNKVAYKMLLTHSYVVCCNLKQSNMNNK